MPIWNDSAGKKASAREKRISLFPSSRALLARRCLPAPPMSPTTPYARLTALHPAVSPFLRAFALGYAADTFPSILKLLLSHFLRSSIVPRSERWRVLLRKLGRVCVSATGFRGVAFASALAIGGGKLLEGMMEPVVRSMYHAVLERRRKGSKSSFEDKEQVHSKRIKVLATFFATALSSLLAISLLQSSPTYQRPRLAPPELDTDLTSNEIQLPYPYSSLTSSTPDDVLPPPIKSRRATNFLVQQSPTLDLTLFLLVRALDSAVRGIYEVSGVTSGRFGAAASFLAAQADAIVFTLSCWRIMVRLPPSHPLHGTDDDTVVLVLSTGTTSAIVRKMDRPTRADGSSTLAGTTLRPKWSVRLRTTAVAGSGNHVRGNSADDES